MSKNLYTKCLLKREGFNEIKVILEFEIDENIKRKIVDIITEIISLAEENAGALLPIEKLEKLPAKEGKIIVCIHIIFTWEDDVIDFITFIANNELCIFRRTQTDDDYEYEDNSAMTVLEFKQIKNDQFSFVIKTNK